MPRRRLDRLRAVTDRQYALIERLARPDSPTQAQVAEEWDISVSTLSNHLQLAYRTLGVSTLAAAARVLQLPAEPLFEMDDTRRIYRAMIKDEQDVEGHAVPLERDHR